MRRKWLDPFLKKSIAVDLQTEITLATVNAIDNEQIFVVIGVVTIFAN